MARPNNKNTPSPEQAAEARAAREDYWVGRVRYYKIEDGQRIIFPDYMGTSYYKMEGIEREICTRVNEDGSLNWVHAPDAPVPPSFRQDSEEPVYDNPVAPRPPYDFKPPAYASDTQSGGPHNFDGRGGAGDNPRDPVAEGEIPGEYQDKLKQFREQLINSANAS